MIHNTTVCVCVFLVGNCGEMKKVEKESYNIEGVSISCSRAGHKFAFDFAAGTLSTSAVQRLGGAKRGGGAVRASSRGSHRPVAQIFGKIHLEPFAVGFSACWDAFI